MTSKATVNDFLAQKTLAVVGVSRDPKAFANGAYKELKEKGYRLLPVNPHMEAFDGDKCFPSLAALPEAPGGALIMVAPAQAEGVVRDAAAAGIKRVWMQPGAESPEAIAFCEARGIAVVHGECIMMFAPPVKSVHRLHRGVMGLFGQLPK